MNPEDLCPVHVIKPPADPEAAKAWDDLIAWLVASGIGRRIDMAKALAVSNDELDRFVDTDKPVRIHGVGAADPLG